MSNNERRLSKAESKGVFIRLCGYVFKHWPLFVFAIVLTLVSNQLSLMGPQYSGIAIDAISAPSGVDFAAVGENVVKMILCYVLSAVLTYCLSVTMVYLSQRIVYTMRRQVFEKLTSLKVNYFDTHATGDIISRISYDIDTINASLSHDLVQVMTSVYTVVGSLIFMWNISKPLIIVFAFTVPISILFTRFRPKKVRPLFSLRSRKVGELNGYAEEMLSGLRTIGVYDRQAEILSRFDKRNGEAMDAYYKSEVYGALMGPFVNFINNLSLSLVMMLGGVLFMISTTGIVKAGSIFFITIGGVAQFVQYSRKFAGPINEFANVLHEFQSAFSAAERVFKVLDEEPEPEDKTDAVDIVKPEGRVDINDVTFGYTPEKTILKNIDLAVSSGQKIAIVGPTGAGKTTIINLLMRFYDVNSGDILIDGVPVRNIKRSSLRKLYTMVLQDTWLFNGTIKENIAYGKEGATDEEIICAAKSAKIHSFIESLPRGYDTCLTDEGVNISKGQRQLITIARAMLSDSAMLILDEATSNVDSRTEIQIQEAMDKLMEGRTCFIIAHRLSTIKNADLILVINDGRIIEQGTHKSLLECGGTYAALYNSQFK